MTKHSTMGHLLVTFIGLHYLTLSQNQSKTKV